ncbi:hypothetical protein [Halanaerobacter jeridensis]|uniref:Uncharacterized protein n=1 Tax=Halanaerobacter jeridensis TaxID=706427 RepID=A0A938XZ21_9FIRM|nr:hypothetical protein [Halanaerobacter jeridensis]MBM7557925.1 hypothetical protein [Halanaerobacter jeridensis]
MKLMNDEIMTSAELMQEFFAISKRKIDNMPEKMRYKKICEYLIDSGAEKRENKFKEWTRHQFLEFEGYIYLIPTEIFDELDENWLKELETA